MASLFKTKSFSIPSILTPLSSLQTHQLSHTHELLFSNNYSKPTSNISPFALSNSGFFSYAGSSAPPPEAKKIELTEKNLKLGPLRSELLAYFADRKISAETLQRNHVMQKFGYREAVIAFTYKRNGALVGCKYRNLDKRFWQVLLYASSSTNLKERDAEKIFYGLDDIKNASDIIIVEGEIDKLSMEEAGFRNCVSVPNGAPPKVSTEDVPPPDQDTRCRYLWNCVEYFDKASRIILATDGDPPGQALAEELARRLGLERCWRVRWPKKNEVKYYKDANEVLIHLGPELLKQTIENAEPYLMPGSSEFKDYSHGN